MAKLTSMPNIGKAMAQKLASAGISTPEELRALGSKEAFFRLKLRYSNVCLVHLFALEGAVAGVAYNQLPEKVKTDLKAYSDSL